MLIPDIFNISSQSIIIIAKWSSFTALLSLFLNFCFREGNIFEGWLNMWADWWLKKNKPKVFKTKKKDAEIEVETLGKFKTLREYKHSEVEWFWFKPLGGCVVCCNVWISFIFIPCTELGLVQILYYVLLSNFMVRYFQEKLI